MKKSILIPICIALFICSVRPISAAERSPFGIGLGFGDPSFVSLKWDKFALGLGGSVFNSTLHAHLDYWFFNEAIGSEGFQWFLGLGARTRIGGNGNGNWNAPFSIGIRVPVGLQYFIKPDIELFAEIAPVLSILPFFPTGDGSIGIRFYL